MTSPYPLLQPYLDWITELSGEWDSPTSAEDYAKAEKALADWKARYDRLPTTEELNDCANNGAPTPESQNLINLVLYAWGY